MVEKLTLNFIEGITNEFIMSIENNINVSKQNEYFLARRNTYYSAVSVDVENGKIVKVTFFYPKFTTDEHNKNSELFFFHVENAMRAMLNYDLSKLKSLLYFIKESDKKCYEIGEKLLQEKVKEYKL